MKKILLKSLLIAILGTTSLSTYAQDCNHSPNKTEKIGAFKEKIWPKIHSERKNFDAKLSNEEKKEIASIREKLEGYRKEMKSLLPEGGMSPDKMHELPEATKEKIWVLRGKMHDAMFPLHKIAMAHEGDMKEIHERLKTEFKDLMGDHEGKGHGKGNHDKDDKGKGHGHHGKGSMHGKGPHPLMNLMRPEGFLLIDPANPNFPDFDVMGEDGENGPAMKLYPNPVSSTATLEGIFNDAKNTKIELVDSDGKVLKTLKSPSSSEGVQRETYDFSSLKKGTYYLKIQTSKGSESVRFIKE